jgi:hypothetical protein
METSFPRYLARFGAVFAGILLVVWLYVLSSPMAFLEGGYPAWVAKSIMLRECQLGRIAFFGDSRLEAGVVPALLPVEASNFGLAAGTAVETHSAVRRALACATLPRQVVISLVADHFGPLDRYFWINDLRYGFISPGELLEAEQTAATLGDTQSFTMARTPDGLSGRVRNWLYAIRFPSLYFGSLVQGQLFGRNASNRARLEAVLQARGFSEYRPATAANAGGEPPDPDFTKTPLQAAEFEQTLQLLQDKGVEVGLLIMPVEQTTAPDAALEAAYLAYFDTVSQRFPGVRLVTSSIPRWPARLFADGAHLAGPGARLFTERLAACIAADRIQPGCDLQWRDADTADAAAPR